MIPSSYNKIVWEKYSTDRWQEIRRAYNVTQVLTYNNWILRLPIVAQNASYLLYEIPE
jgi:isocitrate lyase